MDLRDSAAKTVSGLAAVIELNGAALYERRQTRFRFSRLRPSAGRSLRGARGLDSRMAHGQLTAVIQRQDKTIAVNHPRNTPRLALG